MSRPWSGSIGLFEFNLPSLVLQRWRRHSVGATQPHRDFVWWLHMGWKVKPCSVHQLDVGHTCTGSMLLHSCAAVFFQAYILTISVHGQTSSIMVRARTTGWGIPIAQNRQMTLPYILITHKLQYIYTTPEVYFIFEWTSWGTSRLLKQKQQHLNNDKPKLRKNWLPLMVRQWRSGTLTMKSSSHWDLHIIWLHVFMSRILSTNMSSGKLVNL